LTYPVQDVALVQVRQPRQHHAQQRRNVQRLGALKQQLLQVLRQVLQNDAKIALVLAAVQHAHDVRVVEAVQQGRLGAHDLVVTHRALGALAGEGACVVSGDHYTTIFPLPQHSVRNYHPLHPATKPTKNAGQRGKV
jgi:hypothetical protein